MGLSTSEHIQQFVRGKTIDKMTTKCEGAKIIFRFRDGESLTLVTVARMPQRPGTETIATPLTSNGAVKQSAEIAAEAANPTADDEEDAEK